MKDFPLLHSLNKKIKAVWQFFARYDLHIRLLLFPFILLGIFLILGILSVQVHISIALTQLHPFPMHEDIAPYPQLLNSYDPQISANAAIVMDQDSHVILYQKNAVLQSSMASTTKVMTALVGLDYYKPDSILTVTRDEVEGSGLHLFRGEAFYFSDLLYAMFLPSANDAAMAVADNYPGGEQAFVAAMNQKAKELHLHHTTYQDPAGLEDEGDFTTVKELAEIASTAFQNPLIRQIVGTQYHYITSVNGLNGYQLENLNKLLGSDGVVGIKTGTTEGAGQVLITAKQDGTHTFIIVVMDSTDRYADTEALLHLIDNNVKYITF